MITRIAEGQEGTRAPPPRRNSSARPSNTEDSYRLCYVRGPEGIIVELAQKLGLAATPPEALRSSAKALLERVRGSGRTPAKLLESPFDGTDYDSRNRVSTPLELRGVPSPKG